MSAEDDRTVIAAAGEPTLVMPRPGGQATMVLARAGRAGAVRPGAAAELQRRVAGVNPLLSAAHVLIGLVRQLRATAAHPDPARLRHQLLDRVAEFESAASNAGLAAHQIVAARYLLCAFIDEVVQATPWGAGGAWAGGGLLQEFHEESSGGDKAFKVLDRLCKEPAKNHDLLELYYVCLALGFQGRYQGADGAGPQLDAVTARVLEALYPDAQRPSERPLSLQWEGVATRGNRDLSTLPVWVVLAVGAALVLAIALLVNAQLDRLARPLFKQIHELPMALHIERPALPGKARLAAPLQADVAAGALEVRDEPLRSVVTLPADALFDAGSARLEPRQLALLQRIAAALKDLPGQVAVIGHTDSSPTNSLQFPSNWNLSLARAQAVVDALVQQGLATSRVHPEGHADIEPRARGDAAGDAARNRRVDVELRLVRPD